MHLEGPSLITSSLVLDILWTFTSAASRAPLCCSMSARTRKLDECSLGTRPYAGVSAEHWPLLHFCPYLSFFQFICQIGIFDVASICNMFLSSCFRRNIFIYNFVFEVAAPKNGLSTDQILILFIHIQKLQRRQKKQSMSISVESREEATWLYV